MEIRFLDRSLRRYRTLDTRSVEESRSVLAREICPHALVPTAAGALRTRHDRLRFHASSLHHISYGSAVSIVDARIDDDYLVLIPSGGSGGVMLDGRRVPMNEASGVVLTPGSRFGVAGDASARTLIWRIAGTAIRAAAMDQGCRAAGPSALALAAPAALTFLRNLRFAIEEARTADGMSGDGELRHRIEELLLFTFLRAWTMGGRAGEDRDAVPHCVERVERLIAASAQEELTIADLVAVSGVSERSLHRAFRRFRGHSPMTRLRDERLRRVRAELLDPGWDDTVTSIQTRWGITEFGRFAAAYQRCYGELPSATLRAARESKARGIDPPAR